MKVVGIIQARTGSTRLPAKVLMDLAGEPMLARVVDRTGRARTLDEVVVATTTNPDDESIARLCSVRGWGYFRGSETDVLDRFVQAAETHTADIVVRITSDCPLIEPEIIDSIVSGFLDDGPLDYASNTIAPRTYPRGLDVEVITLQALRCAWDLDQDRASREHVTPYIYCHPERFAVRAVTNDVDYSNMRWTVDTPEDLELVRHVFGHFGHDRFVWHDVISLLEGNPAWQRINRRVAQKTL